MKKSELPFSTLFSGTLEDHTSVITSSPLSPIVEASDNVEETSEETSEQDDCQEPAHHCSPGYIKSPSGVTIELLDQSLWKKFYKLGTEMIITKAGRYVLFWIII